ncbi:MAG: DUF2752 domain-containing protein [Planctomycetota bacterium]|nr:MAG: DUF2752 domain-containing protein [Planctomycetota bacterium]
MPRDQSFEREPLPAVGADAADAPRRQPLRATARERAAGAVVALGALAVLVVAAWLRPDPSGHGTHEQLGMLPCTWAAVLDKPCPTCGMTTSFAYAAHGDLLGAVAAQPFGALLALMTAAAFWGGLHVAATGSMLGRLAGRLFTARAMWLAGGLALAAWAYKIATWPGVGG